MRSFSRFASSVDFSSGEPLGGVDAPTVGADLCVRPSSPERSLFCGRTRRSAPTQATSARQFHSSNAVTLMCRHSRASLHYRPSSSCLSLPAQMSNNCSANVKWLFRKSPNTFPQRPKHPSRGSTFSPSYIYEIARTFTLGFRQVLFCRLSIQRLFLPLQSQTSLRSWRNW